MSGMQQRLFRLQGFGNQRLERRTASKVHGVSFFRNGMRGGRIGTAKGAPQIITGTTCQVDKRPFTRESSYCCPPKHMVATATLWRFGVFVVRRARRPSPPNDAGEWGGPESPGVVWNCLSFWGICHNLHSSRSGVGGVWPYRDELGL